MGAELQLSPLRCRDRGAQCWGLVSMDSCVLTPPHPHVARACAHTCTHTHKHTQTHTRFQRLAASVMSPSWSTKPLTRHHQRVTRWLVPAGPARLPSPRRTRPPGKHVLLSSSLWLILPAGPWDGCRSGASRLRLTPAQLPAPVRGAEEQLWAACWVPLPIPPRLPLAASLALRTGYRAFHPGAVGGSPARCDQALGRARGGQP